jgi:hypothetical protein
MREQGARDENQIVFRPSEAVVHRPSVIPLSPR